MTEAQVWTTIAEAYSCDPDKRTKVQSAQTVSGLCFVIRELAWNQDWYAKALQRLYADLRAHKHKPTVFAWPRQTKLGDRRRAAVARRLAIRAARNGAGR